MQVPSSDSANVLERLVSEALPDDRGLDAWRALLRAHASLMRELSTDLAMKTRLPSVPGVMNFVAVPIGAE